MTTILAVVGDTHINSSVGLSTPICNLDDGGTYHASATQMFLWRSWLDYWQLVTEIVTKNGNANLWVILNGDIGERDAKSRSHQLITRNVATIQNMMVEAMEPALKIASRVFVIRGTEAHAGKSASLEEAFASDIGAVKDKTNKTNSWWSLLLDVEGVRFEIAHHGRLGTRAWTRGNALNSIAIEALLDCLELGIKPPHVILQSHNHRYASSGEDGNVPRVFALPAWSTLTANDHRYRRRLSDIGGMVFVCDGGEYAHYVKRYRANGSKYIRESAT